MKTYSIKFEQFIDLPIEDVFHFFSRPENLSLITPARLKFDILTPSPSKMKEGQLIDYSLIFSMKVFLFSKGVLSGLINSKSELF